MPVAPRKRPALEERERCDCCPPACDCQDCESCREPALEVARDWIPPPVEGAAAGPKAGAGKPKADAGKAKPAARKGKS